MNIFEFADWRVARQAMTDEEAAEAIAWAKREEPQRKQKRKEPKGLSIWWKVNGHDSTTAGN